ncbi:3'-5' exoribonuclease [Jeotgalibacillus alimentarius]|uniref:3'-5' exoribonuclease n=2 Tax=Jeotgalibacillus TaxID=157226 RepID=A0A0C2VMJ9_9BACL|nr:MULTISPECIES: 3'-5' exoribonuclease YhaM [Jeotgalibacillus]KIL50122.1 3'-5' exoribonuclease [Jeotgalibacillus alimentarius]MBM7579832.1 3'-5' exoribonuclease [Jeotgalibacillus terrae]
MNGITYMNPGDPVDQYLLIKQMTKGVTTAGKPFLTLIFQDRSGDIEAKLWDAGEEEERKYQPQTIVKVAGEIHNYRGKNQLRLRQIRPASAQDNVKMGDFLETAPLSIEEMSEELTQYIFEMKNPVIQRITRHLLKKYQKPFLEYPAATKNHHEFVSGLAFHVVSMLRLAKFLTEQYPSLNKDLLYAGIILHDMGKVKELSGAVSATYTLEGNLLGHISIMVNEIAEAAKELEIEAEEVLLLQHMILSHHGKAEWGSPKPPMLMEAEILHYIDNIDAKMVMMDRVISRTTSGEYTERVFALENRSFYRPHMYDQDKA